MFWRPATCQYQQQLFAWFPDSGRPGQRFAGAGGGCMQATRNAIRSYAFAARSGRLEPAQVDSNYLARVARRKLSRRAQDQLHWSQQSAYGSSFPAETKKFRSGGWYFFDGPGLRPRRRVALDDYPTLNDPRRNFWRRFWAT